MTTELRDLMHRAAEDAPTVHVDDTTWARARRSRRRDLVAVPAVALALLLGAVTVGLQAEWISGTPQLPPVAAPPAEAGEGAVPARIYDVPEDLERRTESGAWSHPREEVSVVTRASAAYVSRGGGAIVVSAADGVHHRVDLPGFNDRFVALEQEGPVLAVSPDGRRLAYFWRERVPDDGPRVPSGLGVLDLASGGFTEHPLPGGQGVRVSSIAWSPDGRYLVYRVGVLSRIDALGGFTVSGYRIERLDVRSGKRVAVPRLGRISGGVAVSDDGVVGLGGGSTLFTWSERREPGVQRRGLPEDLSGSSAWADDGTRIALGSTAMTDGLTVVDVEAKVARSLGGLDPQQISVLGWVGSDHVVAIRHPDSWTEVSIDLLPVGEGEERTVGVVDPGVELSSLSLATDLMSPARPTVAFDPPTWGHDRTWWWVGGGVLVLLAGAAVLLVVRRRA